MSDQPTRPAAEIVARAVEVTRRYGDVLALDDLSLDVHSGELVGLLGPNGAGKSTLINLFVGLRRPSSGRVELLGGSPADPARRLGIGVTPQETGLPAALRVGEVVDFVAAHYPRSVDRGMLLDRFTLTGLERRQVGGLSGGQKRRLAVALAFVGEPKVVFLDEPTTGLDVEARRALWDGIRHFHADGGTVVLTSHYLEEVEALAERVVVIGQGRVLTDGTTAEVRGIAGVRRVTLTCGDLPALSKLSGLSGLSGLPGVLRAEREGAVTHLLTTDADALVRTLVRADFPFSDLEIRATSLEEAFLTITARQSRAA